MRTHAGHLTYCTNIHAGELWADHFASLQAHFPAIKARIAPDRPMGIGLRLSNQASLDLVREDQLTLFKRWLTENQAYVFTMNGFPYGGFHHTRVKDQVHAPDWTTGDRVAYTLRLFRILAELMPEGDAGMGGGAFLPDACGPADAGISTSPLSYRHWFASPAQMQEARDAATRNILSVVEHLIRIHRSSGKLLHLDIEPEPDGLLETGAEFIEWFEEDLLPAGRVLLASTFSCTGAEAESLVKQHIRLCYDVCHFAIGYESHREVMRELEAKGIKIGKIQISAALKAMIPGDGPGDLRSGSSVGEVAGTGGVMGSDPDAAADDRRAAVRRGFEACNEPVYLHQVVARQADGSLRRYPDLPEALADFDRPNVREWRAHFHVPIFLIDFGSLRSTREDISEVLAIQQEQAVTAHLEVETYTWEVLPDQLRLPLEESIIRELQWVKDELTTTNE
jgi:hypothetical protein